MASRNFIIKQLPLLPMEDRRDYIRKLIWLQSLTIKLSALWDTTQRFEQTFVVTRQPKKEDDKKVGNKMMSHRHLQTLGHNAYV